MKGIILWFMLLAGTATDLSAAGNVPRGGTDGRILLIEASSMPVAGGEVTLILGALRRTNGVYEGDYRIRVFPYFYKNERGRLAIVVPDAALAMIRRGKVTRLNGTATTTGKSARTRTVITTVTPSGPDRGFLQVRFMAGSRPMLFQPTYHVVEKEADGMAARSQAP